MNLIEKPIIYIDMDDTLCKYTEAKNKIKKQNPEIKYPQSLINFFVNLEPIDDAIESFNFLYNKFDVYILTSPSVENINCYSEKCIWVEKYFGFEMTKKLIISYNKSLLKGNFLIDDNICGRGQENFEGKLIHFGSKNYPSWKQIIEKFKNV